MEEKNLHINTIDDDACIVMDAIDAIKEEMEKKESEVTEK